jgi:uncharacterized coiled-coil DUF342 family protein
MGGVKGVNRSEPSPTELNEEIQKLKTKTDNTDAELETVKQDVDKVKQDVDEIKEKTKDMP